MARVNAQLALIRDVYIDRHIGNEILPVVSAVPKEDNPLAIVSHYFVLKATKTLDAICVLCETKFGEDALVLARTLLELGLHLQTIAAPEDEVVRRQRATSFIYDGDRQRDEKMRDLAALKAQGKCMSWIADLEASGASFQPVAPMPPDFARPRKLKQMATELGGEWECYYHIVYWSISKLAHPSGLGSHTYFSSGSADEEDVSRAISLGVTMHYLMTVAALNLLSLDNLIPPVQETLRQFMALPHG
jgi:Family of unknown function (DUF5677)